MNKRIIYILILPVLFLLASCGNPQELEYQDVRNFRVEELSMTPQIGMDVQFYNPNKFGMSMKDGMIDVFINQKQIGTATLQRSYDVPAADTFLVPVSLKADLKSVVANSLTLLTNQTVMVELKGHVKAGRGVFVNVPINYKGEHKLNVSGF